MNKTKTPCILSRNKDHIGQKPTHYKKEKRKKKNGKNPCLNQIQPRYVISTYSADISEFEAKSRTEHDQKPTKIFLGGCSFWPIQSK